MKTRLIRSVRGVTLIEGLVTIAILALVLLVAGPSMVEWIAVQRVKSTASELVTDLQFARSEAARRNRVVRIAFKTSADQTCYTIHTATMAMPCSCLLGSGSACNDSDGNKRPNLEELKTSSFPAGGRVSISRNNDLFITPEQGLPMGLNTMQIDISGGENRSLRVVTNPAGRPQICKPSTSTIGGVSPCSE